MRKPSAASLAWTDLVSSAELETSRDLGEMRSPCPTMALPCRRSRPQPYGAVPSFLITMSST
eukprot:5321157-Alexandrium_andersonii.AAC.1